MAIPLLEESGDSTGECLNPGTGFFVNGCRMGMESLAGEADLVRVASAKGRCGVVASVKLSAPSPTPSDERTNASVIRSAKADVEVFFFIVLQE
jgi:hypothetical protein